MMTLYIKYFNEILIQYFNEIYIILFLWYFNKYFNVIWNHLFNEINYLMFYKTALFLAIEKENIEIIKYLIMNGNADMSIINIIIIFLYTIQT